MKLPQVDLDYIIRIRREIHRHPEIGFDLPNTLKIIRRELDEMGIPYTEKYGKSSIVATINPDCKGKTIAIRADTDALPIQEETGLPFASECPGKMHACGHDTHTAMLLGTGKMLKEIEKDLKCRVKLFFQAGEEFAPGGAKLMCEDGVMDDVDEAIACHVDANAPTGTFLTNKTIVNANSHGFKLHLYGRASHVARPHLGIDAIAMAARVITDIQFMRAREIDPNEKVIIGIGEIHGGAANNVVCDHVMLHGTIRTNNTDVDNYIFKRIEAIAASVTSELGGRYEIETTKLYPVLINDPAVADKLTAAAKKLYGEEVYQEYKPSMGGEDFAFFTKLKPGAMFKFGVHAEGTEKHPVHNGKFNPDESALAMPPRIFTQYVIDNME